MTEVEKREEVGISPLLGRRLSLPLPVLMMRRAAEGFAILLGSPPSTSGPLAAAVPKKIAKDQRQAGMQHTVPSREDTFSSIAAPPFFYYFMNKNSS